MSEAKTESFVIQWKFCNRFKDDFVRKTLFLLSFSKMRFSVTIGIRKTSYPLNIMWWWQHQSFFAA